VQGIGAGAASVQFLLMSGTTRNLIHKAIMESGSALSPLSLSYEPLVTATDTAVGLGYRGTYSPQDLTRFYKDVPMRALVNVTSLFLPCLENILKMPHSLLERDPLEILQVGDYHMVPMLIAYAEGAGAAKIADEIKKFSLVPENFEHILPNNLEFDSEKVKQKVASVAKEFYLGKLILAENVLKNYMDYINDVTYEYPIMKAALVSALTNSLPVYFMKFKRDGARSVADNNAIKIPVNIFDYFYDGPVAGENEMIVTTLITLWSQFIKTG
jgi:carboxylesterase type B